MEPWSMDGRATKQSTACIHVPPSSPPALFRRACVAACAHYHYTKAPQQRWRDSTSEAKETKGHLPNPSRLTVSTWSSSVAMPVVASNQSMRRRHVSADQAPAASVTMDSPRCPKQASSSSSPVCTARQDHFRTIDTCKGASSSAHPPPSLT